MSERAADFDLERFQRWMFTTITHPEGVSGGVKRAADILPGRDLGQLVLPSKLLSAEEHLSIYADMYYWRLVDILAEDFQALKHAVGDSFYDLMVGYLAAHPSRHWSLSPLGRQLPDYLEREAADLRHRAFLVDLARLEYAIEEVFHDTRSPVFKPGELQAIPPERWGDMRLRLIDALRLFAFDHDVDTYFGAVMNDDEPYVPAPEPTWVVVWRQDYEVWRRSLSLVQFTLLSELQRGVTLAEALEATASLPSADPQGLLSELGAWFEEWTADGFFAGLGTDRRLQL